MLAVFCEDFFSIFRKSAINPIPLKRAKIAEFVAKSNVLKGIAIKGTLIFAIKKVMPPIRPLFSTLVHSAKYAKNEGMPKPNETPKRREMIQADQKAKVVNRAGKKDTITPEIVHA